MPSNSVANTILSQLGGRRFIIMTGAKHFIDNGSGLSFHIPTNNKNRITGIRIELNGTDLYDLFFYKKFDLFKEYNDIYNDQLQEIFTRETGMFTRL